MASLRDYSPFLTPYLSSAERENASARTAQVMGSLASDRRRDALAQQAQKDTAAHYQRQDTLEATRETNRVAEQREKIAREEEEKRRQLAMSLIMEEDPAKQEALRNAASLYGIDVQARDAPDQQQQPQQEQQPTPQQAQQQTVEAAQQGAQQALQQQARNAPPAAVQQAQPQQQLPPQLPQPAPLAQQPQASALEVAAGHPAQVAQPFAPPVVQGPAQQIPVQQPDPNAQAVAEARGSLQQFVGPAQIDPLGPPQAALDQPQLPQQQPAPAAPVQAAPPPRPPPRIYDFSYKGKRFLSVDVAHLAEMREAEQRKALQAGVAGAPPEERHFYRGAQTAVAGMPFLSPPEAVKAQQEMAKQAAERAIDREKARAQAALAAETLRLNTQRYASADARAERKESREERKFDWEKDIKERELDIKQKAADLKADVLQQSRDSQQRARDDASYDRYDRAMSRAAKETDALNRITGHGSYETALKIMDANPGDPQAYNRAMFMLVREINKGTTSERDVGSTEAAVSWLDKTKTFISEKITGEKDPDAYEDMRAFVQSLKDRTEADALADYRRLAKSMRDSQTDRTKWLAADHWLQARYGGGSYHWYKDERDSEGLPLFGDLPEGNPQAPIAARAAPAPSAQPAPAPQDNLPPSPGGDQPPTDVPAGGPLPTPPDVNPKPLPMTPEAVRRSKILTEEVMKRLEQRRQQQLQQQGQ